MKRFSKTAALLLVLCLLLPSQGLSELKRGDRGDQVYQIQQILHESGLLDDEPDGVFGKRTEKAVKAFQERCGYEPNGILDDMQINHITGENGDPTRWFYTDGAGADGRGVEPYCYAETKSDGYSYKTTTTYCEAHSWIVAPAEASLMNGDAQDGAAMYEEAVLALYNELLAQSADDETYAEIDTAFAAFGQMVDEQMMMLEKLYGAYDMQLFQQKRAELLRSQLVFLCEIVNREE